MSIQKLDFAEPFFHIDFIRQEESYYVETKSMVINLAEREQSEILFAGGRKIFPLKGTVLEDVTLTNITLAFVVKDFEACDLTDPDTVAAIKRTWKTLYEASGMERHKGLPYYKSPKFLTGEGSNHLELNFCYVDQPMVPSGPHRDHDRDFDEVHVQILGYGMMRLYDYEDNTHVHQELNMAPGTVHDKMYDAQGKYPWHEYKSVTPCVYCPIELDRH